MFFRKSHIVFFALGQALSLSFVFSQPVSWQEFTITRERNPPAIFCIARNHQGYLFTGSSAGLHRFDGNRFVPVFFENKNITDTVTAIYEDPAHVLWLGFHSGKLARVENGVIRYFNPKGKGPARKITVIVSDRSGIVYAGTNGEGIFYIRNGSWFLIDDKKGLSDLSIRGLMLTQSGDLLATTDQGLNQIKIQGDQINIEVLGPRQGLPDYMVTRIVSEEGDRFWLGTEEKGICLYDHRSKKITLPQAMENWYGGRIHSLLQINGMLWISAGDSLLKYNLRTGELRGVAGASRFNIRHMVADAQGDIWISADNGRILRVEGNMLHRIPFPLDAGFDHLHSLLVDRRGNLWMNNRQNHLIRHSVSDNRSGRVVIPGLNENTDITTLYEDHFGNIWVGTMGKGVLIHDPSSGKISSFMPPGLYPNANILSISGKDKKVFISCLEGPLRVDLPPKNDITAFASACTFYKSSLTGSDYVYEIFMDSKGRTWFATDGNGITMEQGGRYSNYGKDNGYLSDDRVYSVTEDKYGSIWFSTRNSGVYRFDGKTFRNFSLEQGLSDLNISAVCTDRSGNIVVLHRKGMDVLDPVSLRVSYLNSNHGINQLNVEDLGAVTQDTAGDILVSSSGGILHYSPAASFMDYPRTLIENVFVFDRRISDSANAVFNHDENTLTFDFTGLYFSDPGTVFFSYKLEGLDTAWYITTDRRKHFVKLPPGKYSFRVRSSLNRNFGGTDEAVFSFTIRSPYYREPWFIAVVILVILGGFYFFLRRREKLIQRIQRIRQERVRYQFEILRNQVNPHFLFNNFNTLITIIEDDPKLAVEYVEKLSDFFRMIVNYRDKDAIPLQEEINLLQNYYFLQRKRHGNNLVLDLHITEEQSRNWHIPPLTLQLLLENAIKHNVVSAEIPLKLIVELSDSGELTVSNSIHPRIGKQPGAGLGLQNIISRFKLLANKQVDILDDGKNFVVTLPLIKQ